MHTMGLKFWPSNDQEQLPSARVSPRSSQQHVCSELSIELRNLPAHAIAIAIAHSISVYQHIPIPSQALVHVLNYGVRVLHRPFLNNRVNLMFHSEIEHLADLRRRTDQGAGEGEALEDQEVDGDRREGGRTDLDEGAIGAEERDVFGQRHLQTLARVSGDSIRNPKNGK